MSLLEEASGRQPLDLFLFVSHSEHIDNKNINYTEKYLAVLLLLHSILIGYRTVLSSESTITFSFKMLRIIGLLEADFNTALKFFFATQMQAVSEVHGLSDEQWGSRKNRSSIDAGLVHLLAFECGRAKRSTVAEISHDLKACFDRMQVGQSNIYALKRNVDRNLLKCRGLRVTRIKRCIRRDIPE